MSEQQVRLSDKQAMAVKCRYIFRLYRGGDWSAWVLLWKERKKKVKRSLYA
jgi:hypothetical protein